MKNVLLIGLGRFGRHLAMQLSELGLTPRHLRQLRLAAERDVALIEHAVATRGVAAGGAAKAGNDALELADLLDAVRAGVVRQRLAKE